MRIILKTAAFALALAATPLVTAGAANADDNGMYRGNYDSQYDRHAYDRHHHHAKVAIQFGTVATGYRDGYWDKGHRWHRWNRDSDSRDYRNHGGTYHDWNHDRDDSGH